MILIRKLIFMLLSIVLLSCQHITIEQQIIQHLEGSSHVYGGHCSDECNVVEQVMDEENTADGGGLIKHYYIVGTYRGVEFEAYMDTTIGFGIRNKVTSITILGDR